MTTRPKLDEPERLECPYCHKGRYAPGVRVTLAGFLAGHNKPSTRSRCDGSGMSAELARRGGEASA